MKTFPTSAAWCFWILYISVSLKTTGSYEVVGSADRVVALAGDDVILPCSLKPSVNAEDMIVKWTRSYQKTENVHFYRDGRDSNEEQFPSYKGRTSMFYDELKNGNVSLKLTRVTLSDPGSYKCFIPRLTSQVKETTVQLFVGAVSQPVISIVGTKGWGVVLKCESGGWSPEPGMEWLDSAGTILPADGPPERHRDSEDLYTLRRHVTVNKTDTNRFTCRVQQLEINHLRETEIHVPDDVFPESQAGLIVGLIAAAVVVVVALVGVGVYMWRKQHIREKKRRKELEEQVKQLKLAREQKHSDEDLLYLNALNNLSGHLDRIREQRDRIREQRGPSTDSDEDPLFLDALNNRSGHLERIREQRAPSTDPDEELLYRYQLRNLSGLLERFRKQRGPSTDSDEDPLFLDALNNLIGQLERIRKQRGPSTDPDEERLYLNKLHNLIGHLGMIREQRDELKEELQSAGKIIQPQTLSTSPGGQQTTQTPSQKETESIEGMEMETLPGPEMEMESKRIEGMEMETLLGPVPEMEMV